MIDHFSIFTKGGIVLWSYNLAKLKGNPIDNLIRNVILEERGGENSYSFDQYTLKWNFANEVDLILVVVYQKILSLLYIDELLEAVKRKFIETFGDQVKNTSLEFDFTDAFIELLNSIESRSNKEREKKKTSGPKSFYDTDKGKQIKEKQTTSTKSAGSKALNNSQDVDSSEDIQSDDQNTTDEESNKSEELGEDAVRRNIEKMKLRLSQKNKSKSSSSTNITASTTSPTVKPKRGERKWDDVINKREEQALDYSKKLSDSGSTNDDKVDVFATKIDLDNWQDDDPEEEEEEIEPQQTSQNSQNAQTSQTSSFGGKFFSMLQTLSGNKPLTSEDLDPLLLRFRDHLISKNVASDIALKLCDSVSASLQGKKLGTFASVKTIIKNALEESLVRILTPKKSIDIIRDAQEAKEKGKVYTIVFCGVNGVGKSTNLAKTCAFLMQNGFVPMIAACDTFRSAAVEQLAVHCRRLGVELYEKGYRTDPAAIALEAVRQAKVKGKDVVLIDTTGRMQDNLPLMQALAKLVNSVKPDLVLFVGEALVGHDAVDQLVKFNQALVDLSKEKEPRKIDGIILTKFDTIDDKVGAAISMVYTTGQPIVFLGVGQHYTDLKRLNVSAVTKALLKGA